MIAGFQNSSDNISKDGRPLCFIPRKRKRFFGTMLRGEEKQGMPRKKYVYIRKVIRGWWPGAAVRKKSTSILCCG
jgi:hypothetical protein